MKMKKLASLFLVLMMVVGMSSAFAAMEGEMTGGSITIDNAVSGQTYSAYQILYLESYDVDAKAYVYKANSAWESWLRTMNEYVAFDAQGYVTWVAATDDATVAAFAKAAQAQIGAKEADASATATSETVKFENLKLGYYLVDTTLGALCSLDTTNPNVVMNEKNTVPTIDKQVKEDSTGDYGDKNTAQIGDTIYFQTKINAKKGAQNYVLHDKMSAGLTFKEVVSVKAGDTALTAGTDYNVVTTELCAECDFHIVFTQTYLDSITADTVIVVEYTAILNDNAVISGALNTNDTKLDYGDESDTEWDHTDTETLKFDIIKTDSDKKLLAGAQFELYDAQTEGNKIALVKEADGTYRVATAEEKAVAGFESAVIEAGKATVVGLDAGTTYYLEEIQAPAGYNKLPARVAVAMGTTNLEGLMTGDTWTEGGVHVVNQKGSELPSTGGVGTTLFYIAGTILVVGALVLMITKRRVTEK